LLLCTARSASPFDGREWPVLDAVACGSDYDESGTNAGNLRETIGDSVGLPECELAASGSDTKLAHQYSTARQRLERPFGRVNGSTLPRASTESLFDSPRANSRPNASV
jgi:hypothetical protein